MTVASFSFVIFAVIVTVRAAKSIVPTTEQPGKISNFLIFFVVVVEISIFRGGLLHFPEDKTIIIIV